MGIRDHLQEKWVIVIDDLAGGSAVSVDLAKCRSWPTRSESDGNALRPAAFPVIGLWQCLGGDTPGRYFVHRIGEPVTWPTFRPAEKEFAFVTDERAMWWLREQGYPEGRGLPGGADELRSLLTILESRNQHDRAAHRELVKLAHAEPPEGLAERKQWVASNTRRREACIRAADHLTVLAIVPPELAGFASDDPTGGMSDAPRPDVAEMAERLREGDLSAGWEALTEHASFSDLEWRVRAALVEAERDPSEVEFAEIQTGADEETVAARLDAEGLNDQAALVRYMARNELAQYEDVKRAALGDSMAKDATLRKLISRTNKSVFRWSRCLSYSSKKAAWVVKRSQKSQGSH